MRVLAAVGHVFLNFLEAVGRVGLFTALALSHCARKIADRIAMIHGGNIIWSGAVEEIDYSANAHVDQFINGRAEGPIKMEVDPMAGRESASGEGTAV